MTGLLAWVTIGSIAGLLAGVVTGSKSGVGTHIIIGIIGTYLCGMLFNSLGLAGNMGFDLWSICVALIGAVVLIMMIRIMGSWIFG